MDNLESFTLIKKDDLARRGRLATGRGIIETPQFMPVGTVGTVKSLRPEDIKNSGGSVLLVNTYHLYIRPGLEVINKFSGVHKFMNWQGPILSDSGGYQVMSLSNFRNISKNGVTFSTPIDGGKKHFISPEKSIEIQEELDTDIAMCFDECIQQPSDYETTRESTMLSIHWAERCKISHKKNSQLLWGIIQGGSFKELRDMSVKETLNINFPGYALGGFGVGEEKQLQYELVRHTAPQLEENKPRYLMGIGTPEDIIEAVSSGVDLFDCVIPTRNARHGKLYTSEGVVRIKNTIHKHDTTPVDKNCSCYCCRNFSRAYLHHLINCGETLGATLASLHNIEFYLNFMKKIRDSIENACFKDFKNEFYKKYKVT